MLYAKRSKSLSVRDSYDIGRVIIVCTKGEKYQLAYYAVFKIP